MKGISALVTAVLLSRAAAAPPEPPTNVMEKRAAPTVTISSGTIVGASRVGTEAFNGIPFAQPPVGPLRLKAPVKLNSSLGVFDASGIAPACPQFVADSDSNNFLDQVLNTVINLPFFQKALKVSEDCLTISVIRPTGTKAGDKLPVLFWIFGGGFEVSAAAVLIIGSFSC
jgi:carboxylesterase type B